METYKKCCTCKQILTTNNFFNSNNTKDGLQARCKNCDKEKSKLQYLKNKEKRLEYVKEYRKNNKDKIKLHSIKEETINRRKELYSLNKIHINNKAKENRIKNIEEYRIKERIKSHRRRILKKQKFEYYTKESIINLKEKQKNKCIYCKKDITLKYHIDHIIPISKGGKDSLDNIQILCPTCNMKKGAKDPIEFANKNGRLL